MSATLGKPRWETWENLCLQKAFSQKIQHKIMAAALGRTVPSVSKKIKSLGLRAPSSLRGQVKGQKSTLLQMEKTPQDLAKMIKILKTYAPLRCFQTGHLALKEGCWAQFQLVLDNQNNKETKFESIDYHNFPFSLAPPLDFIPSTEPFSKEEGDKKAQEAPTYVPLCYVEEWADAEGFHKLRGALRHRGLSYWKEGSYFSQTQLLMHMNRLRFEHNLHPLALIEEEKEFPT